MTPASKKAASRGPRGSRPITRRVFLLSACALVVLCLSAASGYGQEPALLWGRVLDSEGRPVPGAAVEVTAENLPGALRTAADVQGVFRLVGLPWGLCRVRVEASGYGPHVEERVFSEPGARVYLGVVLSPAEAGSSSAPLRIEERRDFHKTVLDAEHIAGHPSGNNLWNLVENQDLAATSSRID
ncbi:MAG: carboxypeptidase regulatory-like domain-containing protein, partial [Candidatus Aminicenantes bacterium]|nr:carboxypeptidase regulatory-like domain-containing protein [Candidatus Aminicenantes bacterium]